MFEHVVLGIDRDRRLVSATDVTMHSDASLTGLAEEVGQACEAILAKLAEDPNAVWHPRALIDAAKGHLSNTVVSIAFWNLVDAGALIVDKQLVVRSAQHG